MATPRIPCPKKINDSNKNIVDAIYLKNKCYGDDYIGLFFLLLPFWLPFAFLLWLIFDAIAK